MLFVKLRQGIFVFDCGCWDVFRHVGRKTVCVDSEKKQSNPARQISIRCLLVSPETAWKGLAEKWSRRYKKKRRRVPTIRAYPAHINPSTKAHPSQSSVSPDASCTILAGAIIRPPGPSQPRTVQNRRLKCGRVHAQPGARRGLRVSGLSEAQKSRPCRLMCQTRAGR